MSIGSNCISAYKKRLNVIFIQSVNKLFKMRRKILLGLFLILYIVYITFYREIEDIYSSNSIITDYMFTIFNKTLLHAQINSTINFLL